MNNLPEQLIIEIISYNSPADLIALSLTSKLFSKIVNNNCGQFTATFDRYTQKCEWIGTRKYKKVEISTQGLEKFLEIIKLFPINAENTGKFGKLLSNFKLLQLLRKRTFGDYVETLTFSKCEISLENLLKVLKMCKNLKNFSIEVSKITNCNERVTNLPTFNLNKLSISQDEENEFQVLKLFHKCDVKELSIFTDIEVGQEEIQEITRFLQTRTSMKTLKINFKKFEFPILFENVTFPLKKLSITKSTNDSTENAEAFLSLFRDSLEILEIDDFGDKIAGILIGFPYLWKLSLDLDRKKSKVDYSVFPNFEFSYHRHFVDMQRQQIKYYNALPQVKDLKISDFCSKIIPFFPNLKTLKIEKNVCFVNFESFTGLVFLDINICQRCRQIKIPKNLKSLKISIEDSDKNNHKLPPFCFNETLLDELTLIGFKNLTWIERLLSDEKINLAMLKIVGSEIDQNVLKNCELKIKKIIIN